MVKTYHVICTPLNFWGLYELKTKEQLLSFGRVLERMFSFENIDGSEKNEFENLSILGSPFVWKTEIYNVRDITESVDRNLVDSLNIKHIFITDYSFEIISSDPEIISPNDSIYTKLAKEISKVTFKNCHDSNKNGHIFEHLALVTSLKIITCDTADEIEELSIKYHMEKILDHFYINKYKLICFFILLLSIIFNEII